MLGINDTQYNRTTIMLSVIMLSIGFYLVLRRYAECRCAECRGAGFLALLLNVRLGSMKACVVVKYSSV